MTGGVLRAERIEQRGRTIDTQPSRRSVCDSGIDGAHSWEVRYDALGRQRHCIEVSRNRLENILVHKLFHSVCALPEQADVSGKPALTLVA